MMTMKTQRHRTSAMNTTELERTAVGTSTLKQKCPRKYSGIITKLDLVLWKAKVNVQIVFTWRRNVGRGEVFEHMEH